jgi:signal peptidase I
VLGDNRANSQDSRYFGPVKIENIIGKAWFANWPLGDFGRLPHYQYDVDG